MDIQKVSILTVCHNQLQHTRRFVQSLRRYTPQEPIAWNLISVDSGSTDGTREWLEGEGFKVLRFPQNIGWIKGINEGLSEVPKDSDIVIFSNNDVVLDRPGWLERLCAHFSETVGAVGPTSNYVCGRQNATCNNGLQEEEANTLIGFFLAVRREAVEAVGGLDESLGPLVSGVRVGGGDDHDYCIRLRKAGYRLLIARDVFVWHAGSKTFMQTLGIEGYNSHWQACDAALERKWGKEEVGMLFASPLKVAFGIPLRTWFPHWKFASSLVYMKKPQEWNIIDAPRAVVDQARNAIVEHAKKIGAHYLLMLDDDHILPADLFFRLFKHEKEVVGALAFRRLPPFGPCVFSWETIRENGNLGVRDRPDLIKTGLQRVDAIGFGAVLIRMDIFERLGPPPWFKFDEVGEDLTFCDRCAQKGIAVYCDTDLIIRHITDEGLEVDERTWQEYQQFPTGQPRRQALGV